LAREHGSGWLKSRLEILRRPWWLAVMALTIFGMVVRYRDIGRQMLVDDEWHSLTYAATTDAWTLATHYFAGATSIPVNLYHRLLLVAWGWSEFTIRFLSLVATLITLPFLPWVVRRTFGSPLMGLLAGLLFACSPFWIFYGSSARPYAAFLLFLLAAYYFLSQALAQGAKRDWLCFGVSGALAVWFHLFALPALAILALPVLARWIGALRRGGWRSSDARQLLVGGLLGFGSWTLLVLLSWGPALLNGIGGKLPSGRAQQTFDAAFARDSVELLSGARFQWLAVAECVLALFGLVLAYRKNRDFVRLLALGLLGSSLLTLYTKPEQFYVAIVMWRYNISLFLLHLVGLAACLESAIEIAARSLAARTSVTPRAVYVTSAFALAGLLLFTTPVGRQLVDARPNNFRLHSAYQERYSGFDASQGYESAFFGRTIQRSVRDMPRFYRELATRPRPCSIVEYPLEKADHKNALYFYQLQHGCEVRGGYSRGDATGQRIGARQHGDRLRFRRLVDIDDTEALRRSGADFVVVHLDVRREALSHDLARGRVRVSRETKRVLRKLEKAFGKPSYEDNWIRVFAPKTPRS
jgi:hypothetical protein